jgi:hypothetical protein
MPRTLKRKDHPAALSGRATPVPKMIELFQRAAPWETTAFSAIG